MLVGSGYGLANVDELYNQYIVTQSSNKLFLDINTVKKHLSIDLCDKSVDTELILMIETAGQWAEKFTGRVLLNTTFLTFRDFFPACISLRKSPFQSLIRFEYFSSGVLTAVDPSTFQITQSNDYVSLVPLPGQCWPQDADCIQQAIQIEFIAGYGSKSKDIPQSIRIAMLNHIGALYNDRGDCGCDLSENSVPRSSLDLYNMYKIKNIIGLQSC